MHQPAIWKSTAIGAALSGLSFIGAGTAVASIEDTMHGNRWIVAVNDVEAKSNNDETPTTTATPTATGSGCSHEPRPRSFGLGAPRDGPSAGRLTTTEIPHPELIQDESQFVR